MNKLVLLGLLLTLAACDTSFKTGPLVDPVGQGTDPTPTPTPGNLCADARLTWVNPTQNTDNSPITEPLGANRIYFGFDSNQFSNEIVVSNPPALGSYRIINLELGRTYYFAVKAFNQAGAGSDYSAVASKVMTTCATVPVLKNEIVIDGNGAKHMVLELPDRNVLQNTGDVPTPIIGIDDVPKAITQPEQ